MTLNFYPHEDDLAKGAAMKVEEKIEILLEAAERYKAYVLDPAHVSNKAGSVHPKPLDITVSFNWDGLAGVLREVRELPEAAVKDKQRKHNCLQKLAEVYEILRAAKMQKLESVRLVLVSEANQLQGRRGAE